MIQINLFKPEKKEIAAGEKAVTLLQEESERQYNKPVIIVAVLAAVGLISLLFLMEQKKFDNEQNLLQEKQLRFNELKNVLQELEEIESVKQALDEKIRVITDLKSRQKNTVIMMDKLSSCLPDWVWLTNLSFKGNRLDISGKAMSNNLISDFIQNLRNSNYFLNIDLKSSLPQKEGNNEILIFAITCDFIRPAEAGNKAV